MARRKIPVKLILKLRSSGMTRNMISKTQGISKKSVLEVLISRIVSVSVMTMFVSFRIWMLINAFIQESNVKGLFMRILIGSIFIKNLLELE